MERRNSVLINGKEYEVGGMVYMSRSTWSAIPKDLKSTKADGTRYALGNQQGATVLVRVEVAQS